MLVKYLTDMTSAPEAYVDSDISLNEINIMENTL